MIDLGLLWEKVTGSVAVGDVTVGYSAGVISDGCCDLCVTEVADVSFYLLSGGERVEVADYMLGFDKLFL